MGLLERTYYNPSLSQFFEVTTNEFSCRIPSLDDLIGIWILISKHLSAEEIRGARDPDDETREIEDVDDLTFGEYVRLLGSRQNWEKMRLGIDRKLFVKLLNDVREVRNDVMHFRPDSSEPEDLDKVRMLRSLLEQLVE